MGKANYFLALVVIAIFSVSCHAVDNPDAVDYVRVLEEKEQVFLEKIENSQNYSDSVAVYAEYLEFIDKELNNIYKVLMSKSTDANKKRLKTSQLNWLKYRDSEFNYIQSTWTREDYGSSASASVGAYKASLVRNRVVELMHYTKAI